MNPTIYERIEIEIKRLEKRSAEIELSVNNDTEELARVLTKYGFQSRCLNMANSLAELSTRLDETNSQLLHLRAIRGIF